MGNDWFINHFTGVGFSINASDIPLYLDNVISSNYAILIYTSVDWVTHCFIYDKETANLCSTEHNVSDDEDTHNMTEVTNCVNLFRFFEDKIRKMHTHFCLDEDVICSYWSIFTSKGIGNYGTSHIFKYLYWGTVEEYLKYHGYENR